MSVACMLIVKEFGMVSSSRLTVEVLSIRHLNRMLGIIVCHLPILYEHTRNTIRRSRHDVVIIETNVPQRLWQGCVPILLTGLITQSEVPFADGASGISLTLKHICHCKLARFDNHPALPGATSVPSRRQAYSPVRSE